MMAEVILIPEGMKADTAVVAEEVVDTTAEEVDIAVEVVVEDMEAEVLVSTNVGFMVIRNPILVWRDSFSKGTMFRKRESTLIIMMISPLKLLVIISLIPSMCTPLRQLERI
jgi:hypothetical protein